LGAIQIDALILKGGGVKGLAFAGAVRELQDVYDFQSFVGTSAGALAAALLAAGADGVQLEEELRQKPFKEFLDGRRWAAPFDILVYGGIHPGIALTNWIREQLFKLLGRYDEVRMRDLPKRAVIYAAQRDRSPVTFDKIGEHGDSYVHAAVRYSLSIPFFFQRQQMDGDWIYDGGWLVNFPVELFLEQERRRCPKEQVEFIALYLGSPKPRPLRKGGILSDLLSISIERNDREVIERYRVNTVVIDTDPIGTVDFNLSETEKDFLVLAGRAAALQFLKMRGQLDAAGEELALTLAADVEAARRSIVVRRNASRHTTLRRYLAKGIAGLAATFAIVAAIVSINSVTELDPVPDPPHSSEASSSQQPLNLPRVTQSFPLTTPEEVNKDTNWLTDSGEPFYTGWALRLDVDASFGNQQYNSIRYLRSLSELSLDVVHRNRRTDDTKSGDVLADFDLHSALGEDAPLPKLRWRIYLKSKLKRPLNEVNLNFGPISVKADLAGAHWTEIPDTSLWMAARAKITVTFDDPAWVLPFSARLLKQPSGSPIIEVRAQNLTKSKVSLSNLQISGYMGRPICAASPGWQNVTLNWRRIMEGADFGATTSIDGREIVVPVKYKVGPCRDYYIMDADVPVNVEINPGDMGVLYMEITELPPFEEEGSPRGPKSLSDFAISVSFSPSEMVFPKRIEAKEK
jgi:hypothetical protein